MVLSSERPNAAPERGIGEAENLLLRRGLTHGKGLREWIVELLAQAPKPATKFGDLEGENRLRVVGTDLAHERTVVFPEDAILYADDKGQPYTPDAFPIAEAVRISAGFPYFFPGLQAVRRHAPGKGALSADPWAGVADRHAQRCARNVDKRAAHVRDYGLQAPSDEEIFEGAARATRRRCLRGYWLVGACRLDLDCARI